MALAEVRHEVMLFLAQTHQAQREARAQRAAGSDEERVMAAGELSFLARQEEMLLARLAEIDGRARKHRTLFSWARQAWFDLRLSLEHWVVHR
jgi:hypothetical protein